MTKSIPIKIFSGELNENGFHIANEYTSMSNQLVTLNFTDFVHICNKANIKIRIKPK